MCSNGLQGSGVYTYGWWIGGQRTNPNTASTFVWKTDPASREKATYPLTYQNWAPEQPNYKDYFSEACLELVVSIDYRWNDANCDWRCCYVCEIDMWLAAAVNYRSMLLVRAGFNRMTLWQYKDRIRILSIVRLRSWNDELVTSAYAILAIDESYGVFSAEDCVTN